MRNPHATATDLTSSSTDHFAPDRSPTSSPTDAAALLARMRHGDRVAATEFVAAFGDQLRRRVRGKLGAGMRRVFDSQDIMSTVSRRLDSYVASGRLNASDPPQLWSLVFKIIDAALVDKVRVYQRLKRVESEDSEFAVTMLTRMKDREQRETEGPELALEAAFRCLKSDLDREVLSLWLNDTPHSRIAELVGSTPDAVRQRWQSIRTHLREQLSSGAI